LIETLNALVESVDWERWSARMENGLGDNGFGTIVEPNSGRRSNFASMSGSIEAFIEIDQPKTKKLLVLWMLRAHRAASAHYEQSSVFKRHDLLWTVLNIITSIALLFLVSRLPNGAANSAILKFGLEFVFGFFGLLLVMFGVVQFVLRYPEKQDAHRQAGQEFANLQRKIERYLLVTEYSMVQVHNLSRDYNHITKSYPLVDRNIWTNKARQKLVDQILILEDELRDFEPAKAAEPIRRRFFFWKKS
jgi:hypothetical protein